MTCAEVRAAIGADVLGALDQAESEALREHLADCPDCTAAREELAGMPAILSLVSAEQMEHAFGPPDEMGLRRLQARIRARRRRESRRRWSRGLVAAALVAVATAGGGWVVGRWITPSQQVVARPGPTPTVTVTPSPHLTGTPTEWNATDSATKVIAAATMSPVAWGTKVDIVLRGVKKGDVCSLIVVDRAGHRWDGGSWTVAYDRGVRWSGGVAVPTDQVLRIEIVAPGNQHPLVELPG
ncbi:MAG TPA: zf-HC2 domain-containing protein [Actinopolymorphaceae bacterium]|jgi:hypothetical protein|nr:zf-HC2 domain-containing protein [Actinopolymorphaceae bacterium]